MLHKPLTDADFNYRIALTACHGDDSQPGTLRLLTRYSNDCADNGTKKVASLC